MKHVLMLLGLCAFVIVPCFAQGQVIHAKSPITAEAVDSIGGGRYAVVEPLDVKTWAVFDGQPKFENEEQFNGFALSTAGQLGLTAGYNELPGNRAVAVTLNPNEPIRYNGSLYWLDNCKVGGKPYKNRFKPITPPAPPVAAAPPQCCTPVIDVAVPPAIEIAQLTPMPPALTLREGGPPPVLTVTIPKIGFCDTDHDGWWPLYKIPLGMYEKMRCHPGYMILDTALGGAAGYGAYRLWPVKTKVVVEGAKTMPPGGR